MSIKLHPGQSEVYKALFIDLLVRFMVVCCSRGWGKSYLAAVAATTAIFELLELTGDVPNKVVYIIAPTYDQVTDIYFPLLAYELGMEHYAVKMSRDAGRFWFPNGVELRLVSYESVERMRGKGAYFVVWDEISSCTRGLHPKEAWESVIQPCIVTRWSEMRRLAFGAKCAGRALLIGTPKGYNFFYEAYNYTYADPKHWGNFRYDYTESPYLEIAEIERLRHSLDPIVFASEYLASFEESGNNVFYCFDRKIHIRPDIPDFLPPESGEKGEDVHVNIDFNVGLQCSSIWAKRAGQMHYVDEMKGHPDTEQLAIALSTKYKGHRIFAYPDPSGRSRKTSAQVGRTDFSILESYGIACLAHAKAPAIVDSVNAVNKQLMTAAGDTNLYIHPRCKGTIESIERTKWVDNNRATVAIDKSEGIEHYSDGVRYGTEWNFPVHNVGNRTARGFKF
jgi:hypothetical protein